MTGAPPRHWCNQNSRTGQTVKGSTREVSLEEKCKCPTLAGNEVPGGLGRWSWRELRRPTQSAWRAPQGKSQLLPVTKQPWRCDSVSPKWALGCGAGTSSRMLFFLITVCKGQSSLTIQTWQRGQPVLPPQIPAFSKRPFPTSRTRSQIPAPATPFKYPQSIYHSN